MFCIQSSALVFLTYVDVNKVCHYASKTRIGSNTNQKKKVAFIISSLDRLLSRAQKWNNLLFFLFLRKKKIKYNVDDAHGHREMLEIYFFFDNLVNIFLDVFAA